MRTSLILLLAFVEVGLAQAPATLWTRTYGNGFGTDDKCNDIIETSSGGYALAGFTDAFQGNYDFLLVKVTEQGDTLWNRHYGGTMHDFCESIVETSDRGFALAGHTTSYGAGGSDFWLVKTDSIGNIEWTRTYGGSNAEICTKVLQLEDGTFVMFGYTLSFVNPGGVAVWVVKTNQQGDSIWSRTYDEYTRNYCMDARDTEDGGFVLAGSAEINNNYDVLLLKIDSLGSLQWRHTFGGISTEQCYSVDQIDNGNYVFSGTTESFGAGGTDYWLVMTNAAGDSLWSRSYGGNSYDICTGHKMLESGGFVLAGYSSSFGFVQDDVWLLKVDSTGDSVWSLSIGSTGHDRCSAVLQSHLGNYFVAGWSDSYSASYWDVLLTKTSVDPQFSRVVVPNGFEQIPIFSTYAVNWSGIGFVGGVSIELNRHFPDGAWELLADSTENDGEYQWLVADPLSDLCRIRICALQDSFCDVSDGNFSIVSSQGYLGLVRSNQPNSSVLSWSAGSVECPDDAGEWFRFKNFGSEPIVVFQPQDLPSNEFSMTTTCGSFFALSPGGISACSLSVSFAPMEVSNFYDTLRIQTDAVNGVNGYVNIPLSGSQIRTPESPEVVLSTVGTNSVLRWDPVTQSIGHCDIDSPVYLVFFSEDPDGPFWFHGGTMDTSYTHVLAVQYAPEMFYHVYAVESDPVLLTLIADTDGMKGLAEPVALSRVLERRH